MKIYLYKGHKIQVGTCRYTKMGRWMKIERPVYVDGKWHLDSQTSNLSRAVRHGEKIVDGMK